MFKRLDLAPPIGLSSVEVYADADNYEKVLQRSMLVCLFRVHGPAGNPDIAGIDEGFSSISEFCGIYQSTRITLYVDGMMLVFQKCVNGVMQIIHL